MVICISKTLFTGLEIEHLLVTVKGTLVILTLTDLVVYLVILTISDLVINLVILTLKLIVILTFVTKNS